MSRAQSPALSGRLLAAWGGFCLLMVLVGLQERWYAGEALWPWPLFYEVSAMAVASALAAWRWRRSAQDDAWLAQPLQWFWRVLRWTPVAALVFVAALYGLRHAARAAFGLTYEHPPWPEVLGYETLKFSVFYLLFAGVTFALRSHQALAAERLRAERLERLSSEARMAQLTQQMQPHFLHNALNTIASLVHDDPPAADAALLSLSQLLRAATDAAQRPLHTLEDELALARSYTALMTLRFGPQRVRVLWDTAPLSGQTVPALSLQPLLENAFVHAVEARRALTTLQVRVARLGERLTLQVSDDGPGLRQGPGRRGGGVGLSNLRERLSTLYGTQASLQVASGAAGGCVATMELPARD